MGIIQATSGVASIPPVTPRRPLQYTPIRFSDRWAGRLPAGAREAVVQASANAMADVVMLAAAPAGWEFLAPLDKPLLVVSESNPDVWLVTSSGAVLPGGVTYEPGYRFTLAPGSWLIWLDWDPSFDRIVKAICVVDETDQDLARRRGLVDRGLVDNADWAAMPVRGTTRPHKSVRFKHKWCARPGRSKQRSRMARRIGNRARRDCLDALDAARAGKTKARGLRGAAAVTTPPERRAQAALEIEALFLEIENLLLDALFMPEPKETESSCQKP